jgi:hypothetical protein
MAKTKTKQHNKLKMWLIPGAHNKHHPHIIKLRWSALIAMFFIVAQLAYNFGTTGKFSILGYATNINSGGVASLVNSKRSANGLGSLSYNGALASAAAAKANDMFAKGYWSHYSPSGVGPSAFVSAAGYSYTMAGENLAKDWQSSGSVVNAWMSSPAHRANVLGDYNDIGIAAVNGVLNGQETTIVVAMFGKRPGAPAPAPTAAPTASSTPQKQSKTVTSTQTTKKTPAPTSSQTSTQAQPAQIEQQPAAEQPAQPVAETTVAQQQPVETTSDAEAVQQSNITKPNPSLISRIKLMAIASWPSLIGAVVLISIGALGFVSHHKRWLAHIKNTGEHFVPRIHIPQLAQFAIIMTSLLVTAAIATFGSVL